MFNFLALLDIRVFGRLKPLWLLIGLALFYSQASFILQCVRLLVLIGHDLMPCTYADQEMWFKIE